MMKAFSIVILVIAALGLGCTSQGESICESMARHRWLKRVPSQREMNLCIDSVDKMLSRANDPAECERCLLNDSHAYSTLGRKLKLCLSKCAK